MVNNNQKLIKIIKHTNSGIKKTYIKASVPPNCPQCGSTWEFVSLKNGIITFCCPIHKDETISLQFLSSQLPWHDNDYKLVCELSKGVKILLLAILLISAIVFVNCCSYICSNTNTSDYSEGTVTCRSCHKSYKTTSDNGRKIK